MSRLRVLAVGHVTNDALADGVHPGGAALYAGLAACALGAEVTLLTRAGPDFLGDALLSRFARVVRLPAARTTAFEERHLAGGRTVRLLSRAAALDVPLPESDLILACPVADEVPPSALAARPGVTLAAGLQGWLRSFGPDGTASPRAPANPEAFAGCALLSLSAEDIAGLGPRPLEALCAAARVVAVTDGAAGCRLHQGHRWWRVSPLPVEETDPTGAGDVFLATLAVNLALGLPLLEAAVWAVCAGALTVTRPGPLSVPRLEELAEAVDRYRRDVAPPRPLSSGA